jgi:hypothetical protein
MSKSTRAATKGSGEFGMTPFAPPEVGTPRMLEESHPLN